MVLPEKQYCPCVVVKAPSNHQAQKVSLKKIVRLVTLQSNNLVSLMGQLDRAHFRDDTPYHWFPML